MIRWIKMVALALVAGLAGACAAGSAPESQAPVVTPASPSPATATAPVPGPQTAIPPIDAAAPATTETATFALG